MRVSVFVAAVVLTSVASTAQTQPIALNATEPVSIKFVDARVGDAIAFVARAAGITVQFEDTVTDQDRATLTGHLNVVRSTVEDVLETLTSRAGLRYSVIDAKTIRISKRP